jgi:hemoglobin
MMQNKHHGTDTFRFTLGHYRDVDQTFYDAVGGAQFFTDLVDGFYEGVETDSVLRPMYPEGDLADARRHLTWFFEQYWGGPKTYQEERGHPRLRMRHAEFVVDSDARDRWVKHMKASLDRMEMEPHLRDELWTYLVSAAEFLINTPS